MNRKIANFTVFSVDQFEKLLTMVGYHLLCSSVIGHDVYFSCFRHYFFVDFYIAEIQ
jgi:hypothetical protein